jgi:hypothetical protein
MNRSNRRSSVAANPGWSNCVFCGEPVNKSARSREHVIPMWLLRRTGDPNRLIKVDSDPISGADVVRPASTFHFPACRLCNESYGRTLETRAKEAIESLLANESIEVSHCHWLLDWLDKVRVGLWLGYNMLHKEEFAPKFRIDQRIGTKDRIAIISVDPDDQTKGFSLSGMDNQIFRTSQAGMFLRINNLRILSLSFDGLVSRYAGLPYPKEMLALSDNPDHHIAVMAPTNYRLKQDWKEFIIPGATVIAQASFWLGNCIEESSFAMYINEETIPRFRNVPTLGEPEDLKQFVQTQLISNATGRFQYHSKTHQRLRFGRAMHNTDLDFVRTLYILFWRHVLPLNPTRMIQNDGRRRGTILLAMLWIEKSVQLLLRLRQMGMSKEEAFGPVVDELQRVYRAWEELRANSLGGWAHDA